MKRRPKDALAPKKSVSVASPRGLRRGCGGG